MHTATIKITRLIIKYIVAKMIKSTDKSEDLDAWRLEYSVMWRHIIFKVGTAVLEQQAVSVFGEREYATWKGSCRYKEKKRWKRLQGSKLFMIAWLA